MVRLAGFLVVLLAVAPPAVADHMRATGLVGVWRCEQGQYSTGRTRPPASVERFTMTLRANGTADGQGIQTGALGSLRFRFRARWQVDRGGIAVIGTQDHALVRQYPALARFAFGTKVRQDGTLGHAHGEIPGTQSYALCRRIR